MTIEEKRRELFEIAWADSGMEKFKETAWWAFNAALDAVVIELPALGELSNSQADHLWCRTEGYNDAVDDCRDAIESTNLGLKVLP